MRVLVTGCAGFIGSNLCRALLEQGHDVIGVDNLSAGTRANMPHGMEFSEMDIRSRELDSVFRGVDVVFHLAARNCLSDCMEHPEETADINVGGTVRVLEACRAAGVAKIVYAGTSAVYEGIEELPTPEDRVDPIGPYAVSKHAGAQFVASYGRLYGLRYTILRYFNVYGPAQDYRRAVAPVMCAFILRLLRGQPPVIYGDGTKRRDFVFVDDVNRFHLTCLGDSRTDGKTVNLGSGVNYSVLEIYQSVADLLDTNVRPEFRADLAGEATETLAHISVARSLGFEAQIGLKEGLACTIDYFREVMKQELNK